MFIIEAVSISEQSTEPLELFSFKLNDSNWTRTHNHLVRKRTSLAKWLSVGLQTKWLWIRVQLQSLKFQISRLFRGSSALTFRQL